MSQPMIWANTKKVWAQVRERSGLRGSSRVAVIKGSKRKPAIVTTGHFAVCVDAAKIKACEIKAGVSFDSMAAKNRKSLPPKLDNARAFHRTPVLTEVTRGKLARVYRDADGELALYQDLYLDFLGRPETVYAEAPEGVGVDDPDGASWWLMSVRMGGDADVIGAVIAVIRSVHRGE